MKIVVIGGSGLVGSRLVRTLRHRGHDVVAASPESGVDTLTGAGLATALNGASVVVDVTNSRSFDDDSTLDFFVTSSRNLLAAAAAARVKHHVVLSIVGTERMLDSIYFRAKMAQEDMVRDCLIPHTILRSTQFFEFMERIAEADPDNRSVRVSSAFVQPVSCDEVAAALADLAIAPPRNGMIEMGGPTDVRSSRGCHRQAHFPPVR